MTLLEFHLKKICNMQFQICINNISVFVCAIDSKNICSISSYIQFRVPDICTSLVTSYIVKAANSGVPMLLCLALFHSLWTMLNQKTVKNIIDLWLFKIDFRETIIFQTIFIKLRPWLSMLVIENSSLVISSCHLEFVIWENSWFFVCYFQK